MALTCRCLDCGARTEGSRCAICQRRRHHARNHAPPQQARLSISRRQRHRVYQRDGHRCVDCGSPHDLTLDHLVPLAFRVNRSYRDDELAARCRSCNSRKGRAA